MAREQPVPAFDFEVYLFDAGPASSPGPADLLGAGVAGGSSIAGSFAEVSGLAAEIELEEYREGGRNTGPHKFVKWGRYPNLVFRRGVTRSAALWDWYYAALYRVHDPVRKHGVIVLTERGGASDTGAGPRQPVAVWFFRNGLPEKLQGPALNATSNEIAIETLEVAHEGLHRFGAAMLPALGNLAGSAGTRG